MVSSGNLSLVEAFYQAYNDVDITALEGLVSDDIHWEHHNRFTGSGKAGLMESLREWAERVPGRRFGPALRHAQNGELLFVEHQWFAVPAADNDQFGWKAGETVTMDTASVFVVRDGKIVEWSDYG